jgi:hypothetical protein
MSSDAQAIEGLDVMQQVLYPVVDEMKASDEDAAGLEKRPDCVLYGPGSVIQSLQLVTFVLKVQTKVEDLTGRAIELASEKALSRSQSPYRTLQTLADYVRELLSLTDGR